MEIDEGSFTELFVEAVREFGRATARREAAQRAVECVVERVGRFSGDDVPSYMQAYNEEMSARDVDGALRLEFFCRITAPRIQAEVKELGEALVSWEAFEEVLWRKYGGPPKSRNRRAFDQWVASAKTHRGAAKAFQEFGRRFARLPEREQRLVGADKVLLFVRSVDLKEREAIGIELEEDDGANGLTEDWSKVGRVCQRMDEERAGKARRKTRDGAPSPQEEDERKRAAARLGFKTRIASAYAALEAMLEAEEESLPCERTEDWYDGTAGKGAGQDTLPTKGKGTAEDKAEDPIASSESKVWQSRASQPEIPDIGQSNSGGVWAIEERTATLRERTVAMDKSANNEGDSTRLPVLASGMTTVGSEYPRESQDEECSGDKPGEALVSTSRKDEAMPSEPVPVTSMPAPMRSREAEEVNDGDEEPWHDAREECTKAYETVNEGPREQPDRGPCRTMLQVVWYAIRPWFVRPRPKSA